MNNDPRKANDVTDQTDEAGGLDEFAEFAATMKRAGVDWEPFAPPRARIARGTAPPELEPADDLAFDLAFDLDDEPDDDLDDDFDDAITLELPVLTRPKSDYDWLLETAPALEQAEDTAFLSRRRRMLARLFGWAVALVLLTIAIALWWAMRADHSSMPAERGMRSVASAPAVTELPELVVELDSPMSLPAGTEAVGAAPPARDGD